MEGEQGSASTPVLSEWLGYWVFITYMSGPNLDTEDPSKPVKGQPEAMTAAFLLEKYGALGIEVRRSQEYPTVFMSWSGVLSIQGPPPEAREEIDREVAKQTGDSSQN